MFTESLVERLPSNLDTSQNWKRWEWNMDSYKTAISENNSTIYNVFANVRKV